MEFAFDSYKQFITFIFHFIRLESGVVVVRFHLCLFALKIVVAAQWEPPNSKDSRAYNRRTFCLSNQFFLWWALVFRNVGRSPRGLTAARAWVAAAGVCHRQSYIWGPSLQTLQLRTLNRMRIRLLPSPYLYESADNNYSLYRIYC